MKNNMNEILLSGDSFGVTYPKSEDYPDGKRYSVSLVDNSRNYEVRLNGKLIYRKPACWATYYEVSCIIGV